jgi:predicted PurR-regulated permease PerM
VSAPAVAPPSASAWPPTRSILRVVLTVVACALALYLIYLLRRPLTWIFIAGFLAIALSGPVSFLQRRMRRGLAVAIVYLALVLVPVLIMGALVPPIVEQGNNLAQSLPQYARDLSEFVQGNGRLRQLEQDYDITGKLEEQAATLPGRLGDAAGVLSGIGVGVVNSLFAAITILVLSVFMIGSGRGWLDAWANRYPPERSEWLKRLYDRIGNTVGNYVAGALLQATVAGLLAWIMLSILGVPYALPLAVVVFLLDLVPLVGATLGAIIVGVVTLFSDFPTDTIVWVIFSVIYQQVENTVIQPRIQARAVAVHPFVVLVSVLFGSTLFGVLGALLAIPVAAAIQISIREYYTFRDTRAEHLPPPGVQPPEVEVPPADDPPGDPPPAGAPA